MQLVYAEGACSLAVHIMLEELGVPYEATKVSLHHNRKVLESYNHRGYVPALILNDGTVLTEATSILQYLSVTHSDAYMPKNIEERAKCVEWLTFLSTEIHKGLTPFFARNSPGEEYMSMTRTKLELRLQDMNNHLRDHAYLVGETYSVADMYAFAILRLIEAVGVSLEKYQGIQEYKQGLLQNSVIKRILEKEKVQDEATELRVFPNVENQRQEPPQPTL